MSFTQDELQAFNSILEQRLSAQRRELERGFDKRFNLLKRDFEQRMESLEQSLIRTMAPRFTEQQEYLRETLEQHLETQQNQFIHELQHENEQAQREQQAQFEGTMEHALAAQLLAMEQLFSRFEEGPQLDFDNERIYRDNRQANAIEAIEVQTEIPWDEVTELFNKILDDRMKPLTAALQDSICQMEHHLLNQIRPLAQMPELSSSSPSQNHVSAPSHSIQELLVGIEQLERIIESVQVVMTANHAFLSNRLFHHQQLPFERAHPRTPPPAPPSPSQALSDLHVDLSLAKEPENVEQ